MHKIIWTANAIEDLESIIVFISRDSTYYARIFSDKIFGIVENLSEYPLMGRIVPEFNDSEIREIIYGNYRIIYRVNEKQNTAEILTIHHAAMRL